jgi:elongator complex protein 1
MTTVLTAYLRSRPARTDEALQHVLGLFNADVNATAQPSAVSGAEKARAALKYVMLLVDVDALYNAALGSYNLAFALMVAQVAQMDPKEYLPFLQSLRAEPELLRKHRIDLKLGRHTLALQHLAAAGADHVDTCIDLARTRGLFPQLLAAYSADGQAALEQKAAVAYAEHLVAVERFAEGAALYERAGKVELALSAYAEGAFWREALGLAAAHAPGDQRAVARLARQLVEKLQTHGRGAEAAVILERYTDDVEAAVAAYCETGAWPDALRLAAERQRADLITAIATPALALACEAKATQYHELTRLVHRHTDRLAVVRVARAERALAALHDDEAAFDEEGGGGGPGGRASDLYSEASTARSRATGSSSGRSSSRRSRSTSAKSSKNRRKHEAKKLSLREGGEFEAEALLTELHRLVGHIAQGAEEVQSAALAALRLGLRAQGAAMQVAYAAARQACAQCVPRAWEGLPTLSLTQVEAMEAARADAEAGGAGLSTNARVAAILAGRSSGAAAAPTAGVGSVRGGSSRAGTSVTGEGGEGSKKDDVPIPPRPAVPTGDSWRVAALGE